MGDEGLDRISYYSLKHEVLAELPEQAGANTGANPTLSPFHRWNVDSEALGAIGAIQPYESLSPLESEGSFYVT